MNKTKTNKLNILETRNFSILASIMIVAALFVYLYSYQLSVSYAATIENTEDRISNLKSEISEVEFRIVESKRLVSKSGALSAGFTELQDVTFVKRSPKTALNAVTN